MINDIMNDIMSVSSEGSDGSDGSEGSERSEAPESQGPESQGLALPAHSGAWNVHRKVTLASGF